MMTSSGVFAVSNSQSKLQPIFISKFQPIFLSTDSMPKFQPIFMSKPQPIPCQNFNRFS